MVALHPKKSFKTKVSYVSSNVFQKVVTIKNPCSTTNANAPPPPPPPPPPAETRQAVPAQVRAGVPYSLRDDLCCSVPVPLTIVISNHSDQDTVASELSCEWAAAAAALVEDRPPTPRPDDSIRKTLRKFCLAETIAPSTNASVIPTLSARAGDDGNGMEWPSDEEDMQKDDDDDKQSTLAFGAASLAKLDSVCGLDFWNSSSNEQQLRQQPPTPHTNSSSKEQQLRQQPPTQLTFNSWGLMITNREDQDEGVRTPKATTKNDGTAEGPSGSTYEYREPMVTLRDPYFI